MMATPADLEDFAVGFSLTEGIIGAADDIRELEVVEQRDGIELRMWLAGPPARRCAERRRALAGPTGCGLCGVDSLEAAVRRRAAGRGDGRAVTPRRSCECAGLAGAGAVLNHETRAVHGAGFWSQASGLVALREDVGRHNALDKLVGAVARAGDVAPPRAASCC